MDDYELPKLRDLLLKRGFSVEQIYCGRDAIDCVENKTYDLIILDYCLPDMKGPEIAKEIRETDKDVFIIGYSGYWDSNNICCGLDDYAYYDIEERVDAFLKDYKAK